jgi:hypothetical protein
VEYSEKLGAYLAANYPNSPAEARSNGAKYWIEEWPQSDGPAPTPEQVAAWQPSPVAAVTAALAARERQAAEAITSLKATAAVALVVNGMSEPEAYVAGSALVVEHSAQIQAFILAGGNPVAAQALFDAITASPPAWWSEPMEALFSAGLGL